MCPHPPSLILMSVSGEGVAAEESLANSCQGPDGCQVRILRPEMTGFGGGPKGPEALKGGAGRPWQAPGSVT